ncbi:M16 family metallopeptidase [Acrocarpospora catenulata]|uniref:M16 family metallopeptidase n=1 Tax=Acrocarpospora catenulata TaxID=2836182 RepID=UPI001BDA1EEE|nr:pitrilysin family protein [Acrocarpospora catenulata]
MNEPVRGELAGGVPVWVAHRPGAGATTVTLWLRAGSRHEEEDTAGVTHLLEHVLMQAPSVDGQRPVDLLEALGGEADAITSREYLVLYARVPTEETRTALEVLGRALAEPALTGEVLEAERRVVREELRLAAGDPADVVHDVFFDLAFPGHAMGRPVGGTAERVARLDLDALRRHHARFAGTAGVVVCGGAEPRAVLRALEKGPLADLSAVAVPGGVDGVGLRAHGGRRALALNSDTAGVVVGGAAVPYGDRLEPAWQVLMDLVAGAGSALLTEELRNRRGLAYDIWAVPAPYRDTGTWRVYVATAPEHVEEVVDTATWLLIERAARGWPPEEVARAARRVAGLLRLETEQSLEEALRYGRHGLVAGRPDWTLAREAAAIEAVTAADIAEVTRRAAGPLAIAVAGPE